MINLRTLEQCCRRAQQQLERYTVLYHQSAKNNGERAKQTVFYANLCNNAANRVKFWEEHPPVT